ncbi:hypothetical protein [Scytonema sp. NUACC26]|uniref:hypothetical protein n=1 Tax=Scytonema sp. NUACC26 TaxID=3140176 RepID=UPI0034DC7FE0
MTLTYCKGLPTRVQELNHLGLTQFEMFLAAYSPIVHTAMCETVAHLLTVANLDKSKWNSYLQTTYKINKRHANGIIADAKGRVDSATLCRAKYIKQLEGKLKSALSWLKTAEKKLKDSRAFYAKKNWLQSKTGCQLPLASSLKSKKTNWQELKFLIHNKKRYIYKLEQQIQHLLTAPIRVVIPKDNIFIVGSQDETLGNSSCQWDGDTMTFRVPYCLEEKFGKYISTKIGNFDRNINRLRDDGAKTWHFYRKGGKWVVAVQFTPKKIKRVSRSKYYGCIGIDINPGSIGWAYVDSDGNLRASGQIPLRAGLPKGQQQAQLVDVCLQLAVLAKTYACPIVAENLDFSEKKQQLREQGRKYSRMLSGWAYSEFFKQLQSILANRGIKLIKVNPAYTSIIGLVKYARQYALPSDCAAAVAIARRGMKLTENIPSSITAYLSMKDGKHVWSLWNELNTKLKQSGVRRHAFYSISNWEFLPKQSDGNRRPSRKRKQ